MSAQLPYLPPLGRYVNDVRSIATGTAEDVRAAQGAAAKAGLITRGALATVPAAVRAVNDIAGTPARVVTEQATPFLKNLIGGPQPPVQPPTLGLPQLAKPAAPAVVSSSDAPATQAPVASPSTTAGGITTARAGNNVMITGQGEAAPPVMRALPTFVRSNPVAVGAAQQAAYARAQQERVLAGAQIAAAEGNPDNASYRYAAALHALPTLAGSNNFASANGQFFGDLEAMRERERSNIRTTGETRHATDERAKEVRRNAQPTVIGEEINPDPATRPFVPTIKRYGFVEHDEKTGKIIVRDMQGNEQKPAAPPVSRSDFITKNKKANPGMSEGDLGREYDKKYGGKS